MYLAADSFPPGRSSSTVAAPPFGITATRFCMSRRLMHDTGSGSKMVGLGGEKEHSWLSSSVGWRWALLSMASIIICHALPVATSWYTSLYMSSLSMLSMMWIVNTSCSSSENALERDCSKYSWSPFTMSVINPLSIDSESTSVGCIGSRIPLAISSNMRILSSSGSVPAVPTHKSAFATTVTSVSPNAFSHHWFRFADSGIEADSKFEISRSWESMTEISISTNRDLGSPPSSATKYPSPSGRWRVTNPSGNSVGEVQNSTSGAHHCPMRCAYWSLVSWSPQVISHAWIILASPLKIPLPTRTFSSGTRPVSELILYPSLTRNETVAHCSAFPSLRTGSSSVHFWISDALTLVYSRKLFSDVPGVARENIDDFSSNSCRLKNMDRRKRPLEHENCASPMNISIVYESLSVRITIPAWLRISSSSSFSLSLRWEASSSSTVDWLRSANPPTKPSVALHIMAADESTHASVQLSPSSPGTVSFNQSSNP
mmetsp:Transcript_72103/g.150640  ORF Transcript_72103/g.150640 Transcript_72103/m.150640 type:complete len:488 (-) Transcript_72103:1237-2700(-)